MKNRIVSRNRSLAAQVLVFLAVLTMGRFTFSDQEENFANMKVIIGNIDKSDKTSVEGLVGKTQGGTVSFGPEETVEVRSNKGIYIIFDLKITKTDNKPIGLLSPIIRVETGETFPAMLMGNAGDKKLSCGMIIDGKVQKTNINPAIYKTEASMRLCFDVPAKAKTYELILVEGDKTVILELGKEQTVPGKVEIKAPVSKPAEGEKRDREK